ncbi:UNKNOWN [Stylonychia lemnae]|uniref:Uncharacterized protein n=1 Tax=Stylonychia lemnae TaxID=5949 RepID=A0A078AQ42_STYLE|nr:UNKNOWN [Stylonychia lemnae]|eukprot:CDW84289.1 UNKNOWN [Stylonychia lemnae]
MDKGLYLKENSSQLDLLPIPDKILNNSYSLEFCIYFASDITTDSVILKLSQLFSINVQSLDKIKFNSKSLNSPNSLALQLNKWDCMIFASSPDDGLDRSYHCSENQPSFKCNQGSGNMVNSQYLNNSFLTIGQSNKNYNGYIRNLKLYSLYRSVGSTIREQVSGQQLDFEKAGFNWIALPIRPVICNGDSLYSYRDGADYCQQLFKMSISSRLVVDIMEESIKFQLQGKKTQNFTILFNYNDENSNRWNIFFFRICDTYADAQIGIYYKNQSNGQLVDDKRIQAKIKSDLFYNENLYQNTLQKWKFNIDDNQTNKIYLREIQFYSNAVSKHWVLNTGFILGF